MKNILLLAVLMTLGCVLAGCGSGVVGSGTTVTREFDFTDFDTVSIEHAFIGSVTRGDEYRVVVTLDDNLEEFLEVTQDGRHVTIGLVDSTLVRRATLEFEIILPALSAINASGASEVTLSGFNSTEAFAADASGASRISGDTTAGDTALEASGASTVALEGAGGAVRAHASGASTIDMAVFATTSADVEASGASTIIVNTSGTLDANASGASNVRYLGSPTLGDIEEDGASNVEPR